MIRIRLLIVPAITLASAATAIADGEGDGDAMSDVWKGVHGFRTDSDGFLDGHETQAGSVPLADDAPCQVPGPAGLVIFTPQEGAGL